MTLMTGGQALVQSLKVEGVLNVFGIPGIQLDWAFDALWEERDSIDVVHTRHEQATAYMADGFARSTGQIGACLVVPGPGLLNASGALATAYGCSSPVLCISGQLPTDVIGQQRGLLHEINNQAQTISSVCKHVDIAMSPEEVPQMVHRAMRELRTGRPRPVEIEVPQDVLERTAEVTLLEPEVFRQQEADTDGLAHAARILGQAERPLIFAGGGVLSGEAWEELRELAQMLEAPVLLTDNARGALSDRHHLAHRTAEARTLAPEADVILAVGTRLQLGPLGASIEAQPGQTLIRVDIDADEVARSRVPNLTLIGDARHALGALARDVPAHNRARPSREAELTALKQARAEELAQQEPLAGYGLAIRDELPDDGILVGENTQVGYWCSAGFPVYEPRTYLSTGYQHAIGAGFATALGVQVGNPDRAVVSINGDGGFMYNVQELATMAQFNLPVVAIVFDDGAYGNVRRIQERRFDGHTIGSELRNPNWTALAESFGVAGMRATSSDELRSVLREALASRAPTLIEVPMPDAASLPTMQNVAPLPPRPPLHP